MFISRKNQLICILLIVLSLSSLYCNHGVVAARYLKDMQEVAEKNNKPQIWNNKTSSNNASTAAAADGEGFFATINREVPSCPDPLHNR